MSSSSGSGVKLKVPPAARAATISSLASSASPTSASIMGSAAARVARCGDALDGRVGDQPAEQPDGTDRVVVGGDDVVELIRVDVGVARADDRDLQLARLRHRDVLTVRIDHEQGPGKALHAAHAAERALESRHLVGEARGFLLGEALEVAVLLARLELVEETKALLDGHEVGEHAAQPALVDVGHLGPRRLLGDRLLGLLLGADEEHGIPGRDRVATNSSAASRRLTVCARSMMWMPLRSAKM